MVDFIQAHGGMVGLVLVIVGIVQVLLSTVASILNILKLHSPPAIAQIAAALSKVVDFLSANVQHPDVPADPAPKT